MTLKVLLRGGGDLASGVAARLQRAGAAVVIAELQRPLVVRRKAAFAEAVFAGQTEVGGITARKVGSLAEIEACWRKGEIAVAVDPGLDLLEDISPHVLVDARMRKTAPEIGMQAAMMVIGLGPGFTAGEDCHAVIETQRGHDLGRVIWQGAATPNTGIPGSIGNHGEDRILRAPADGEVTGKVEIGAVVSQGDLLAEVNGAPVQAKFDGVLRGLVHDGLDVKKGMKIGDLDPRGDPSYCATISDKALAVGGGVLEAVLSNAALRAKLCS